MLGILTILSLGMTEKVSMLFLIKNKQTQEIKIMFNYIFISMIFGVISYFKYPELDFSFFSDIKFYIAMSLENIGFYFAIKNYNKQKSFSQIAFAAFSSIYLMIGFGYLYREVFNIKMAISSPYHSIEEVIGYSILFFVLTILYFSDKIKNKDIKHPLDLILYAVFLVNTLFFAILMFQTYQSFFVYIFIFISLAIQQLIWSIKKHSFKNIKSVIFLTEYSKEEKKNEIKNTIIYFTLYLITFLLSVISGNLISVEFFAIFKRTGAIISSYVIDSLFLEKKSIVSNKDKSILFIIFSVALYLFYR